jgi:hypothetical protein
VSITLCILAGCVGLLIGTTILFAVRLHIAEDSVQFNTKSLVALNDSLVKSIKLTDQHFEAHRRFMRNAVKDASYLGADYMCRLDEHDKQIAKLQRVGHSHAEMNLEKPKYHIHIDGRDIRPKPE